MCGLIVALPFVREHKTEQQKINRYGHCQYAKECEGLGDTYIKEETKQENVDEVVDEMTDAKSYGVAHGGCTAKSEISSEEEIADQRQGITYGVGYKHIDVVVEQKIDAIVNAGSQGTHNAEAQKFVELFSSYLIYQLLDEAHNPFYTFHKLIAAI